MKRQHISRVGLRTAIAVATATLAASAAAHAQAAITVLSDQFVITNGAGKVVKDVKVAENAVTPETTAVHRITLTSVPNLFDPSQVGLYTALFDPGPVTSISDIVGVYQKKTATGTKLFLAFASDTATQPPSFNGWTVPGVAPPPPIPEQGPIDVTRYLNPALRANGWRAVFTSDADPTVGTGGASPIAIPEPATWALMLLGGGFIGAGLRLGRRVKGVAAA